MKNPESDCSGRISQVQRSPALYTLGCELSAIAHPTWLELFVLKCPQRVVPNEPHTISTDSGMLLRRVGHPARKS